MPSRFLFAVSPLSSFASAATSVSGSSGGFCALPAPRNTTPATSRAFANLVKVLIPPPPGENPGNSSTDFRLRTAKQASPASGPDVFGNHRERDESLDHDPWRQLDLTRIVTPYGAKRLY